MSRIPDSKLPDTRPRSGAAMPLFIMCVLVGGAGFGFDVLQPHAPVFWIGALTGARAVIGAAVAVLVISLGHLARLGLARRIEGESDAGDHV